MDHLERRHTKEGVRVAVFEHIELYYNKRRRHSAAILIMIAHFSIA
ncbi:MAG: hypothetical protein LBB61_03255 [Treponema sp.]|nr:hypothetical protein [Treponema sp.]